ncbi:ankyrin repeat-containing [Anaeramoeba flamelloides]|uniref:Ankyrin repeat-containing n=1 Tax=Anaeramoeba flamelloides TaxID=1746091 RepID=A0AAV7ZF16_9EUKA|nr:ankyrin repeat-containing [Anaeramoeba flamelloides]
MSFITLKTKWNSKNINKPYCVKRTGSTFRSALHWLCSCKNERITVSKIEYLLSLGANINLQSNSRLKSTPLDLLCWKHNTRHSEEIKKCILYLIEQGSNPFLIDPQFNEEQGIGFYLKNLFPFAFNEFFCKFYLALTENKKNNKNSGTLTLFELLSKEEMNLLNNKKDQPRKGKINEKQIMTNKKQKKPKGKTTKGIINEKQITPNNNQSKLTQVEINEKLKEHFGITSLHLIFFLVNQTKIKNLSRILKIIKRKIIKANTIMMLNLTPLHVLLNGEIKNPELTLSLIEIYYENLGKIQSQNIFGQTPLMLLCLQKNPPFEIFESVITKGTDISRIDFKHKRNALHYLCLREKKTEESKENNYNMIHYLIKNGIAINCQDYKKNTALHLVCLQKQPDIKIIKLLINSGTDLNLKNKANLTILHLLIEKKKNYLFKYSMIKLLIENGVNHKQYHYFHKNLLQLVCSKSNVSKKILKYFSSKGYNLNNKTKDKSEMNCFHLYCSTNNPKINILQFIMGKMNDINDVEKENYQTGFDILCQNTTTSIQNLETLLKTYKIKLNKEKNEKGNLITPLHYICQNSRLDLNKIKLLIKYGSNINSQTRRGETPFHFICKHKNLPFHILNYFFKNQLNNNTFDNYENTGFSLLCLYHYKPSVKLINYFLKNCNQKINLNYQDKKGETILHKLLKSKYKIDFNYLTYLISLGMDLSIKNKANRTPFHYICNKSDQLSINDFQKLFNKILKIIREINNNKFNNNNNNNNNHNINKNNQDVNNTDNYSNNNDNNNNNNDDDDVVKIFLKKSLLSFLKQKKLPNLTLINIFLAKIKNINFHYKNDNNNTPFHLICKYPQNNDLFELIKLFTKYKINFNLFNNEQLTGFHLLIESEKPNIQILKFIIDNGYDINLQNKLNQTAFHLYLENNTGYNEEILKLFLNQKKPKNNEKINLNLTDHLKQIPFHIYCKKQIIIASVYNIFELFIKLGSNINSQDDKGNTPFHLFLQKNKNYSIFIFNYFLSLEPNLLLYNKERNTILHLIIQRGNFKKKFTYIKKLVEIYLKKYQKRSFKIILEILNNLLNKSHANLELMDLFMEKILLFNIKILPGMQKKILKYFVQKENFTIAFLEQLANIGFQYKYNFENDCNILHLYCCCTGKIKINVIKYFLKLGFDINSLDQTKRTPFHYYCKYGKIGADAFHFFLENGTNINQVDTSGMLPIHYLCCNSSDSKNYFLQYLISNGQQIEFEKFSLFNYFLQNYGTQKINIQTIKCCLDQKIDVNFYSEGYRMVPLHFYLEYNFKLDSDVIELLLQNGADPNNDKYNFTPFQILTRKNYDVTPFIEQLLKYNSNINCISRSGRTPLILACECYVPCIQNIKCLIRNGADVNNKDKNNTREAFQILLQHHDYKITLDIVKLFMKNGLFLNRKIYWNTTYLSIICYKLSDFKDFLK